MGEKKNIFPAFQRIVAPATGLPALPQSDESEHALEVSVVFTSAAASIAALRKAGALTARLRARITLVVTQIVPYPLPIESPPVPLDLSEQRYREIAAESLVETTVRIYLCRDRLDALKLVLGPRSLLVIGGPRRWWPTRERRLAAQLRLAGHEIVFTETE